VEDCVDVLFPIRLSAQDLVQWVMAGWGVGKGGGGLFTSLTSSSTRLLIISSPSIGGRSLSIFSFAARRIFEMRYWRSSGDWSSILR
jgi:hypothetical protein